MCPLAVWLCPHAARDMPVSIEQWRASLGSNNAARSRVLTKCAGKGAPQGNLSQLLLFLLALAQVTNKGKAETTIVF